MRSAKKWSQCMGVKQQQKIGTICRFQISTKWTKWKMDERINSYSSSESGSGDSSIQREFSPDLGFHDYISSPTGSITDFQDEWEKIEGSRFKGNDSLSLKIWIRFGVPWLDAWFSRAQEDDKLGETFLRFSSLFIGDLKFVFFG